MEPTFTSKTKHKLHSDSCLLYKTTDGKRMKLHLKVHPHSYFFYFFNHALSPSTSPLIPTELTDDELRVVYYCVLMSFLAYEDRSKIVFPNDIQIIYEEFESSISKIPFFIVVDKEINSIIISCRGSSCTDDFITDSMGNGVNFDGGKIHQGIFNTATYIFEQIQNKILDLNSEYNGEIIEHANINAKPDENINDNQKDSVNNTTNNSEENKLNKANNSIENKDNTNDIENDNDNSSNNNEIVDDNTNDIENDIDNNSINNEIVDDNSSIDNENINDNTNANVNENSSIDIENVIDNSSIDNEDDTNKTKIIVTGHSLGAGVASIVAHLFKEKFPKLNIQCICFAPPPTVSFNLWVKSASYIKSFMIEGDMVPFLSVQNIVKFSKILFPDDRLIRKFIEKYIKKMSIDEVSETFMKEKLYPPGQLYLIRLPQTNPSKKKKHKKMTKKEKQELKLKNFIKQKNISLCQILNPEYFSNFVKNIQETNHKCKNYMKAIIRLRQQQKQEQNYQDIISNRFVKKK